MLMDMQKTDTHTLIRKKLLYRRLLIGLSVNILQIHQEKNIDILWKTIFSSKNLFIFN